MASRITSGGLLVALDSRDRVCVWTTSTDKSLGKALTLRRQDLDDLIRELSTIWYQVNRYEEED